jgi:phage terminase large subunit GpA-like protein
MPRQEPELGSKRGRYKRLEDIASAVAREIFRRPERRSVTAVAEQFVRIKRTGGPAVSWSRELARYMVEPQDSLASRELSAVVFVGPSQSGKTESLILNYIAYGAIQDPMDMILYSPTQHAARDFSVRRVDRMTANSPELRSRLVKSRSTDSKFNKIFRSGMILTLSWPTVSEMAGKPVGRVMLTDYDRMEDDIEGEGSPFDLASMRTTTFGSLRMAVAESSPSRPIEDPRWIASSPHEAPPCKGILGLYNRGDRRRWYWPCLHCSEYFEGKFEHLKWEEAANPADAADTVRMICPHCGGELYPSDRSTMQEFAMWLPDGQSIDADGNVVGPVPRNETRSYWLNGVAAGFQSWGEIVVKYLNAAREFELAGSEQSLQQFYNNVLGVPYKPKAEESLRLPEVLHTRAEPIGEKVSAWVRFLIATVDVQKNAFVVQVHGISPGMPYDVTIVDRFSIYKSNRVDEQGDKLWVKPATFLEDWDILVDEVMRKTYPIDDESGREMVIKLTVCDSGGFTLHRGEGVTTMAYEFYRVLRRRGLASRFHLVRGSGLPAAPRTWIDYPDQRRKDKLAAARGDVPVLYFNANLMKDDLSARLDSTTPGKGMVHFPDWLPIWFFKELCAERRTEKGWINSTGGRNEAWDLLYYCLGTCVSPLLQIEKIDWASPPSWAADWDRNPLIVKPDDPDLLDNPEPVLYDFATLGKALA